MAEEPEDPAADDRLEGKGDLESPYEAERDTELRNLIAFINAHEEGHVGITVFVHGMMITGMAIGIREYMEHTGGWYAERGDDPEAFMQAGKRYQEESLAHIKEGADLSNEEWTAGLPRDLRRRRAGRCRRQ